MKMQWNWEQISFYSFVTVFLILGIYCTYTAFSYKQLKQALLERGVVTTGTIIACINSVNTNSTIYEYEVAFENDKTKTYQAKNFGGGSSSLGCKEGDAIMVRYLPEQPEKALHEKSDDFGIYVFNAIVSFGLVCAIIITKVFNLAK